MKHINFGKRSYVSTEKKEKTEKQLVIYTKSRLENARVCCDEFSKLNDLCAAWGDKYEKFNLGLEKFGVDVDALKIPAVPKRYF